MPRLSLRQLEIIRAIMRTGSLTAAANALGISQPAASRLLRHGEDQLGFQLFERQANGLSPTIEVRALTEEIDRVFTELDHIDRALHDAARLKAGRLRIAAIPSLALTVVAEAVGRFTKAYPEVSVAVETAMNYEVADLVMDRRVELGLAYVPTRTYELAIRDLCLTHVLVALSRDHPLAGRPSLSAGDLQGERLISFSNALPIGEKIDAAFAAAGVLRSVALEVGHSFLASAFVAQGAGIALVDGFAQESGLFPNLAFVPFHPAIPIRAVLITAGDRALSRAAAQFANDLLRSRQQEKDALCMVPPADTPSSAGPDPL
ncbi:MAG: LysR family transcriptional regulator [Devosia sp.]